MAEDALGEVGGGVGVVGGETAFAVCETAFAVYLLVQVGDITVRNDELVRGKKREGEGKKKTHTAMSTGPGKLVRGLAFSVHKMVPDHLTKSLWMSLNFPVGPGLHSRLLRWMRSGGRW